MFSKIDRYLLIAILIVVCACLYFLFTNKRDTNAQSDLMIAIARNLRNASKNNEVDKGSVQEKGKTDPAEEEEEEEEEEIKLTPAQEAAILKIADKLCFGIELDPAEEKFYSEFKKSIDAELVTSKTMLNNIIDKFLSGASLKDFHEVEKEFYENNQANIDTIIYERKLLASITHKIKNSITEFTEEEEKYKENNPKLIEEALSKLKQIAEGGKELKGANPPLAAAERLKLILSFFDDKKVKTITELAEMYAESTKTKMHKGNVGTILGNYVNEGKLKCIKESNGSNAKVYHGLPQWFSDKKLIAEFAPAHWLNKEGKIKYDFKGKVSQ